MDQKDFSDDKFLLPEEEMDERDLYDYYENDPSDRDLLLPDADSQNLFCDPGGFGYTQLSLDSQSLSEEEHFFDPSDTYRFNLDHNSFGEGFLQNTYEASNENETAKLTEKISENNLLNKPNENLRHNQNDHSDENLEQNCEGHDQIFFHGAKSPVPHHESYPHDPLPLTLSENNFHQPKEQEELSFEDKVKHLRARFKGIPLTALRNILQREDVEEDLNAAIECLQAISAGDASSMAGSQDFSDKTKKEDAFGSQSNQSETHNIRELEDSSKLKSTSNPFTQGNIASNITSSCEGQNEHGAKQNTALNLEAKIKLLQQKFESIPPLMIKIVLQRSDVEGDLDAASKCLEETRLSSTEAPQRSKQEPLRINCLTKQKPPLVMPKKHRNTGDRGKSQSKSSYDSTHLTHHSVKKPVGSESTLKQQKSELNVKEFSSVSKTSSPKQMDGGKTSCPSELGGKDDEQGSNFEPDMILIKGLNKVTSDDTIMNFAESRTKEQVREVVKLDETSALIKLTIKDFKTAKEKMERTNLEGVSVTVHRVPVNSSILVHNLTSDTTHDALEYYFSNPRIGGEVTSIQYEEWDDKAVVTFKDPHVMQKVLRSKSLKLNGAPLLVECFNPFIHTTTKKNEPQHQIAVNVDKNVMEFISATNSLSDLKESLRNQGFCMTYTSGDAFLYVTPKRPSSSNRERGVKVVTDFAKHFEVIELDVDKNHWGAVVREISRLNNEFGKDKLLIKECASSKDKVSIICKEPDSKELKRLFIDKIAETQRLEDMNAYERDTTDIEKEKLRLLKMIGYEEKLLKDYSDLELDIDEENGKVTIAGPRKLCYEGKVKMYQELSQFYEKQVSLSESVLNYELIQSIKKEFDLHWRTKQMYAQFHTNEGCIFVLGINKKHADRALDIVKSFIIEARIQVTKEALDIIKTQKWVDFCKKVSQESKVCVRIEENFGMRITGMKENVSRTQEIIKKALEDISLENERNSSSDKDARGNRKDELVKMEAEDEDETKEKEVKEERAHAQQVSLESLEGCVTTDTKEADHEPPEPPYVRELITSEQVDKTEENSKVKSKVEQKVAIGGAKIGGAHSQEGLWPITLSDFVARPKGKAPKDGFPRLATSDEKMKGAENKLVFRKVTETYPPTEGKKESETNEKSLKTFSSNDSSNASSPPGLASATSASAIKSGTSENVTISWKKGNIVTEFVSIQVGSTIGKLFDIFVDAGGPEFLKEVSQKMSRNQMVVNNAGYLPCNQVILVSCCKWDGLKGEADKKLRSILRECLQQALQLNATSIAFPIIGTGGLGSPYDRACHIMISEVINITSKWEPSSSLKDIRFVVFDQDKKLVNAFQQEFKISFNTTSSPGTIRRGIASRLTSLRANRRSRTKIRNALGEVSVEVLQGDLTKETTDAIVNINASSMNMQGAGVLSKAVAAAAGPTVQAECSKLGKQIAGSAVMTCAGNLKAKHIIHLIPGEASVQHIQTCIEKCFQTAENSRLKSISLPACGTGGLQMSDRDSAQATFQAIANVCPSFKHLKQIRIVIFQSQMLPAFKARML